jgi:hypothetical protein
MQRLVKSSGMHNPCSFCGSFNQHSISVTELHPKFVRVIDNYYIEQSHLAQATGQDIVKGEYLYDMLQNDFRVFSPKVIEPKALLSAILSNHNEDQFPIYNLDSYWFRKEDDWTYTSLGGYLNQLKLAIDIYGHSISFDPGVSTVSINNETKEAYDFIISSLSLATEAIDGERILWRARIGQWDSTKDLSAPPPYKARAGRANLQGQPVLYLSDKMEAAIAEVRPSVGDVVSVTKYRLIRPVRMCLLIPQIRRYSPFAEFEKFQEESNRTNVRRTIGKLFSDPIRPTDEPREYLITQFLSGEIRRKGFDGIIYLSSQSVTSHGGTKNYLFFNPEIATQEGMIQYINVDSVQYKLSPESPLMFTTRKFMH